MYNFTTINGIQGNVAITAGTGKFYQCSQVLSGSPSPVTTHDLTVDTTVLVPTRLSGLFCQLDAAAGSGKNVVVTVYVNGVATALACTISGTTAKQAVNNSVVLSLSPGDSYSVFINPDSGASSTKAQFGVGTSF